MTEIDGIDYGPLAALVGEWRGDSGMDIAPESDGTEENPYFETIVFTASGDVTNGEEQKLAIVHYHQLVSRHSTGKVFHNESGYYTWHSESGVITLSFTIPRGVGVVAGGQAETGVIELRASLDDDDYSITQAPFMRDKASTQSFTRIIEVTNDQLNYRQSTVVDIYGNVFDHTDENVLTRSGG